MVVSVDEDKGKETYAISAGRKVMRGIMDVKDKIDRSI